MGGRRRAPAAAPPRRPASTSARTPAPAAPSTPAPVQQSSGGGMLSGIGSTIAQGMAFGTGSAIAHRAVGAVAGSLGGGSEAAPVEQQQAAAPAQGYDAMQGGACANDKQLFFDCLKANNGDAQSCNFLYEQLQQCQQSSSQATFY